MSSSDSTFAPAPTPAPAPASLARRAYPPLVFTMLCWAGNAVASRMAVGEVSPMVLVSVRWLGVVLVLALTVRKQFIADWPVLRRRVLFTFAMGGLGFTAFNALFYLAGHMTTAVNIGIIQGAIPIFVLLGAVTLHRSSVSTLQLVGIPLTLLGVILVATGGHLEGLLALQVGNGDLMMILACLLYAGYTLGLRKRPQVAPLSFFALLAIAAFVTTLPLLAIEVSAGKDLWPFSLKGWAIIAYVTLFPSFVAQLGFMRGVRLIGPDRAGIFVNLVPVFAAVLAVVILGEPFGLFHGLALILVLGGIYLAERGKHKAH